MKEIGIEKAASNLEKMFNKLSVKSKSAIVNPDEFSEFNRYMHIQRPIQDKLEDAVDDFLFNNNKTIIFIVGNVGDGKSHILSCMTDKFERTFEDNNVIIHNDATETKSPDKTAIETLIDLLEPFKDEELQNGKKANLIIAINLGVLTNLLEVLKLSKKFEDLTRFFEDTEVLTRHRIKEVTSKKYRIVSFIGESNITIEDGKVTSLFYQSAFKKVFSGSIENPFYKAFLEDRKSGEITLIQKNYRVLMNTKVQETIVYLLIRAEIEYKLIISARTLFNFFYDITTVGNGNANKSSLTYLLFENHNKSDLLDTISKMDPIKNSTKDIDQYAINIYHAKSYKQKVKELLGDDAAQSFEALSGFDNMTGSFKEYLNIYLRMRFLYNYNDELFNNRVYVDYLDIYKNIFQYQKGFKIKETRIAKLIDATYSKWNGYLGFNDKIVKNRLDSKVKTLIKVRPKPHIESQRIEGAEIIIDYSVNNEKLVLVLDYKTFYILACLKNGYFLKAEDRKNAVNFEKFINSLIRLGEKDESDVFLYHVNLKTQFKLSKQYWGEYQLERIN